MIKQVQELRDPARPISYGIVQPGPAVADGVPIVRVNNFTGNGLDLSSVLRVSPTVEAQYQRSRPRCGDVLVSLVGSIGQVAIAPPEIEGWNLARAVGIIPTADDHHSRWIAYALRAPDAQAFIHRHANTTVQATFNLKDLAGLPIPYPPRADREAALSVLVPLDDKIELNRRMNGTLEAMAQAIFRDWFVDFGPVRRKLAGATDPVEIMGGFTSDHARATELAHLFPDVLSDDELPEGWRLRAIGDLVEICGGSTPSTADESLWRPAEHRWATPKDLSDMSDLALFETGRRISSAGLTKITSGLLPPGTVLLSSRAPIGYLAIAQAPVAINQGFIALKPSEELGSAYLYLWCKAHMEAILANANGSTFQEISKKNFRPITSALPEDAALLRSFANFAQPLIDRIVAAAAEARTLAETRDYLLPRLMRGEVRVHEADEETAPALAEAC